MEATEKRSAPPMRRVLGTRGGTVALAIALGVLSGLVLILFLSEYRESVKNGAAPAPALVAESLIPKGTAGDVVIGERLFRPTSLPEEKLESAALSDAAALAGGVAVRDIYPGQQLTADDFAAKADGVRGRISGDERAVAVPVDTAHGLLAEVRAGDHVDVLAGFNAIGPAGSGEPVVRTLMRNVLVLGVPEDADSVGTGKTADVTLRVSERSAAALAYAADNGKVWLSLRPPAGATQQEKPVRVDLDGLLAGSTPIRTGGSK